MVSGLLSLNRFSVEGNPRTLRRTIQLWYQKTMTLLGIHRVLLGNIPEGPCLIVSNHLSWVDILLIGSFVDVRFVAKAEVAKWPIVGTLASGAGTLFVRRGDRHSAERIVADVASELTCGHRVVIFPEGTTTRGPMPIKFRSRLFQAACQVGVPIVPVALSYEGAGKALVSYADDDQFISHLFRICGAPFIHARISVGKPLSPREPASTIAKRAQLCVERMLQAEVSASNSSFPSLEPHTMQDLPKEAREPINLL
jgi:1-acyl-sn-glycerol-3-phosphate acyltransferase